MNDKDIVKEVREILNAPNAYTVRLQIRELLGALADEVTRLRAVADRGHDELCTARRQRDDLAAKCAPYLEQLK